jgi:hypothetical protein
LANASPELRRWQVENLYPNGTAALEYARNNTFCIDSTTTNYTYPWSGIDVYSTVKGGEEALLSGVPGAIYAANKLGTPTAGNKGVLPSSVPVFMYHSKCVRSCSCPLYPSLTFYSHRTDEIVSYAGVREYYRSQCKQGAKIHLSTTSGETHTNAFLAYFGDAYAFLDKAFNGTTGVSSCTATNDPELSLLSPGYIAAIGSLASGQLIGAATSAKRFRL